MRRSTLAPIAALGLIGLAGCDVFDGYQPGATSLLSVFEPTTPDQAADWALDEYDANNRYQGLVLLANADFGGQPIYLNLYRERISDVDPGVRQAAVRALGLHGEPSDAITIAEMLQNDDDRLVRMTCARALQRLHNPEAIDALIQRMDFEAEQHAEVRAEAAHALGQYRDPLVLQNLIAALDDRSLTVNHNAMQSLETLTGQSLGYDTAIWLAWVEDHPQPFAAARQYTYPGFNRPRHPVEWLPFIPQPPKAPEAPPVGLARDATVAVDR